MAKGGSTCRPAASSSAADVTAALVDLHFNASQADAGSILPANHVEWVGLLRSCSALEAYCRCYTADLRPERIAEFLLLNSEFPRSVRFAAARVEAALRTIAQLTGRSVGGRAERLAGRLHASLDYGQVDEILSDDPHAYLEGISRHCRQIHTAIAQSYIMYPIESALPAEPALTMLLHHPPRHQLHLRARHQRERDGSAHAAAQRGRQRCVHFGLSTTPSSRVMMYQDHDGNIVHHFNIPGRRLATDGHRRGARRVPPVA